MITTIIFFKVVKNDMTSIKAIQSIIEDIHINATDIEILGNSAYFVIYPKNQIFSNIITKKLQHQNITFKENKNKIYIEIK